MVVGCTSLKPYLGQVVFFNNSTRLPSHETFNFHPLHRRDCPRGKVVRLHPVEFRIAVFAFGGT